MPVPLPLDPGIAWGRMNRIYAIDSDSERRAEVCRVLLEGDRHVEPFETIGEFLAYAGSDGFALIHDAGGAAIRLCEEMRDDPRAVPVIGYDQSPGLDQVVAAMQAGAASYLAWPFGVSAIDEELDRLAPRLRVQAEAERQVAQAQARLAGLTAREREVLVSLMTHGTNKAIAKHLDISPRTVEKYRATILQRLGVANSAQAIRIAVMGGAFDPAAGRDATPLAGAPLDTDDPLIS